MDSTTRLVGPDAPHVELPFHFLPVGQRDMEEDNPIARHLEFQEGLVAARLRFLRLREYWTHPRMRHVSLNRDVRARERFAGGTGQLESDCNGSNPRGLGRDFVCNRNKMRRFDGFGTAG